jgi:hypothetical protein
MGYDKKVLIQHLRAVFDNTSVGLKKSDQRTRFLGGSGTTIELSSPEHGTLRGAVPDGQGPSLSIVGKGVEAFDAFLDESLKDPEFNAHVGRKAITKALNALLRSSAGACPSDLEGTIKSTILQPLRAKIVDFVAYLPVGGLAVTESVELGPVTFVSADVLTKDARPIVEKHEFHPDQASPEFKQQMLEIFDSRYAGHQGFAEVHGKAHPEFADDLAIELAILSLNVLRSYALLVDSRPSETAPRIGLPTERWIGLWGFSVFHGNGEKKSFTLPNHRIGWPVNFGFNADVLQHLKDKCFLSTIHEVLLKGQKRNSLELAIVQAFQALGRATLETTLDMKLVGATIALERLLVRDGDQSTTEKFADRLAFGFKSAIGDPDGSATQSNARRAKVLYGLRSEIVHAASTGTRDEDAEQMFDWAILALIETLSRLPNFTSHDLYCNYLHDAKYAK